MDKIKGKIIVLFDDVDTDQILPGYAMAEPLEKLGDFAMAGVPDMVFSEVASSGCILVAGRNFGCGSSREQAPIALKKAGVALVVAKGFSRIFRRNAINIGLPVFASDILEYVKTGDEIEVDLELGIIRIDDNLEIVSAPLSEDVRKTLDCGGLIERVRVELRIENAAQSLQVK